MKEGGRKRESKGIKEEGREGGGVKTTIALRTRDSTCAVPPSLSKTDGGRPCTRSLL